LQKRVTKARKASGKGQYNWIKYVSCHHHTTHKIWSHNVSRSYFGIVNHTKQHYFEIHAYQLRVQDTLGSASMRSPTVYGKKFASPKMWAEYRSHKFFLHSENTF
jgi:hypothetical protein